MKPIITFFVLLVTTSFMLGQTNLELSLGPTWSNVSMTGLDAALRPQRTMHPGLEIQALIHQSFGESSFGFSSGIKYKEKGFILDENMAMNLFNLPINVGIQANTTMRYIEAPLNLEYTIDAGPAKIYAFAGPTLGYALSGDVRTKANFLVDININKTDLNLNDNMYNRLELGANLGVGTAISFGSGSILFQASYSQGLNRVLENTLVVLKLKNYGFGINIGYKIML